MSCTSCRGEGCSFCPYDEPGEMAISKLTQFQQRLQALERLARSAIAREDTQRAYDRTPPVISADTKEEWLRLYWARNDGNREYNAALEEVRKWI